MREIKFRAWDKINKAMKHNVHLLDSFNEYLSRPKEWDCMQFTGLLDKNDKEIYEGDIMVWPNVAGVWPEQLKPSEVRYPFVCGNAYKGEIIGNIHENPELLK